MEYTHGWAPADVPADIRLVTLSFARRVFATLGTTAVPGGDVSGETIGAYSYTLSDVEDAGSATSFAAAERECLDRYRIGGPASGSRS